MLSCEKCVYMPWSCALTCQNRNCVITMTQFQEKRINEKYTKYCSAFDIGNDNSG